MAGQKEVRAALENRLQAFATSKSLPVAWENKSTEINVSHLRSTLFTGNTRNPSMGTAGDGRCHKRYVGILRIQVCLTELNKGPSIIESLAEELVNWFPRGSALVKDTVTVNLDNTPTMSPVDFDANFVFVSIDIPYRSEIY